MIKYQFFSLIIQLFHFNYIVKHYIPKPPVAALCDYMTKLQPIKYSKEMSYATSEPFSSREGECPPFALTAFEFAEIYMQ